MKENLTHFFGHYRVQTSFFQLGAYVVDAGREWKRVDFSSKVLHFQEKVHCFFAKVVHFWFAQTEFDER